MILSCFAFIDGVKLSFAVGTIFSDLGVYVSLICDFDWTSLFSHILVLVSRLLAEEPLLLGLLLAERESLASSQ